MNIVVLINLVPDLVEELSIAESGTALDMEWLRLIINEFDDHAMEQAILLKEQHGGHVTVIAPEVEGADGVLFTASARGADRLVKLTGIPEEGLNNHALARAVKKLIAELGPDLVLTGVQTHHELDGSLGPLMAAYLDIPYAGYVSSVSVSNGTSTIRKEHPGGLLAEMAVTLPAVLGIQAAEAPPRYVAISKVRQAMQTVTIEEHPIAEMDFSGGPTIGRMFLPEVEARAAMLTGDEDEIAEKLIELFKELGVL